MYHEVSWEQDPNLSSPVCSPFLLHTQPAHILTEGIPCVFPLQSTTKTDEESGPKRPHTSTQEMSDFADIL